MVPSTIGSINRLPEQEKREIYARVIPQELLDHFGMTRAMVDSQGRSLLELGVRPGSSTAEMRLYHKVGFPDPVLYGQIQDTLNGQFHILLYILNDPESPRYDVDRMPDGTPTNFGITQRNVEAETAALQAGLAPGQVRHGLRMLRPAIQAFENFVSSTGHELYFAEPLYYHNAILFERYGFNYQQGRRLMQSINQRLGEGGDLLPQLDGSTPFRQPEAAQSIRLRSWAIHDGILGQPFTNVTMYKNVGKSAGISTCEDCRW